MRNTLILLCVLTILSCGKEQLESNNQEALMSVKDIDQQILNAMGTDQIWDWSQADNKMLYSALMQSDSILSIGYAVDGLSIKDDLGSAKWSHEKMTVKRNELIEQLLKMESDYRSKTLTQKDLLPFGLDDDIPNITIQITNPAVLEWLNSRTDIRYVEPSGYYLQTQISTRSSSGCDDDPDNNINSADYDNIAPGCKEPWNFDNHGISTAWNCSQGDNIGICIVDTGASDNQDNLGSQFTSGFSGGRWIDKQSTLYSGFWWWQSLDSPHDDCGHGTSMAGLAAAPRGTDGNATGVAYKSNLLTINAVEDVIINTSHEKNGVKNALIKAGKRGDMHVISMSIGSIFSIGKVKDGVQYAYNKGKLIMAAAGTSTSFTNWFGVIFPASMNETTAITGVKDQATLERCNTCHSGNKVDYVITMQRAFDSSRNSLSLAGYSNQPKYISGSSCATATAAGIAALVWANDPGQSRSDVLNTLTVTSQLYPNQDSDYGYGNLNAAAAVCAD